MTTPKEALHAVARAISDSGKLPSDMGVVLREADETSDDADVDMPLLEIQIESSDYVVTNNTDRVGYVTDGNGNKVGRIFDAEYELTLRLDLWTIEDTPYNADELGAALRDALYPYSSYGPDKPFVDHDGNQIDKIGRFVINEGSRDDEFIRTPTVRRWTQTVELWACETFTTDEDTVLDVDTPLHFEDEDGDGLIESTFEPTDNSDKTAANSSTIEAQ